MAINPIISAGNNGAHSSNSIPPADNVKKAPKSTLPDYSVLSKLKEERDVALKSGTIEDIISKGKNLSQAQSAFQPNKQPMILGDYYMPKVSLEKANLDKAEAAYQTAQKANNIDEMLAAQKNLAKAKFEAAKAGIKETATDIGGDVLDEIKPNNKGIWNTIKNHPWITGAVVLAATVGAYLATRKDEATIDEAA